MTLTYRRESLSTGEQSLIDAYRTYAAPMWAHGSWEHVEPELWELHRELRLDADVLWAEDQPSQAAEEWWTAEWKRFETARTAGLA